MGYSDLDAKKPCCQGFDDTREYRDLKPALLLSVNERIR